MKNPALPFGACRPYDTKAEYFRFVETNSSVYLNYYFAKQMVAQFAPGIDICVGGYGATHVEIIGPLPQCLRRGLRQAVMCFYPLSRNSRKEPAGMIVYRKSLACESQAFNIQNWDALADLLLSIAKIYAASAKAKGG